MAVAESVLGSISEIEGWFSPLDARVFIAVDELQRARSVRGDLLEIGVFQGRSAVLLGYFRQEGERLVACDLFERSRQRRRFEDNWARFHGPLPEVHAMASSELRGVGLSRSFRLAHVDGGHD